jgi:hypothetical protein
MDFVSDALFDGRRLRALTVVDAFTREALAIEVDQGIKGARVVEVMTRLAFSRGAPKAIRVDNGPEFVSKALDRWAYENAVTLDFSRPGKPIDNAFVESFNGRLRDECLNAHWFLSLADAKAKIETWRRHFNECPSSHCPGMADTELWAEVGDGLTGRRRRIVGVFAPPLLQQRSDTPCRMLTWSSCFNQGRSPTRSPKYCATGRAPCWLRRSRQRWRSFSPSISI